MNFLKNKVLLYGILLTGLIIAMVVGILIYSKNVSNNVKNSTLSLEEMSDILDKTSDVNSDMGKTIDEVEQETNIGQKVETIETIELEPKSNEVVDEQKEPIKAQETKAEVKEEKVKEFKFIKPVEGDILREFAKDNLVYSETLEEWVTHLGIDILAPKTTVVKAAEEGKIESIKNDPRYGITITMSHIDGYQTVYANLLTTEFVKEGENVEKGQSIGTVGNTAAFEIADESHLHFEILKDSKHVDPSLMIK